MQFDERPSYEFIESSLKDIILNEADKLIGGPQNALGVMLKAKYVIVSEILKSQVSSTTRERRNIPKSPSSKCGAMLAI